MIKSVKDKNQTVEIDLTGPEGNAFCLLGYAKSFGRDLGLEDEEVSAIQDEMTSGDYEHLVNVFEKHFGSFVILYR